MVERHIRQPRFPVVKQLESFDIKWIPGLNKMLMLELVRGDYIERRENAILLKPSGVGKTHIAPALGLAAYQKGLSIRFTTASRTIARVSLPIIDDLCYAPLSQTGSELLFDIFS